VVAIKAHLGPGPRAVEAAGIKERGELDEDRKQKNVQRRIRSKRKRNAARKAERQAPPEP
jgi:hypothetical protein